MAEFTSLKMHYSMSQNFLILPYFLKNLLLPVILNLFPPLSLFYPLFLFLLVHNPPNYPLHLYNNNTFPIILHQNLAFPFQPHMLLLLFPNLNLFLNLSLNLLIPLPFFTSCQLSLEVTRASHPFEPLQPTAPTQPSLSNNNNNNNALSH